MAEYSVANQHPGFGKDPNILNEFGHTKYPRWVDHPTQKRVDIVTTNTGNNQTAVTEHKTNFPVKVLVNNPEEEAELLKKNGPRTKWD